MFDQRRKDMAGYAPIPFQFGNKTGLIPGFIEGFENMNYGDKSHFQSFTILKPFIICNVSNNNTYYRIGSEEMSFGTWIAIAVAIFAAISFSRKKKSK